MKPMKPVISGQKFKEKKRQRPTFLPVEPSSSGRSPYGLKNGAKPLR
jgi:hypothetical protein